jgi:hypothetical protein
MYCPVKIAELYSAKVGKSSGFQGCDVNDILRINKRVELPRLIHWKFKQLGEIV